MQPRVAPDDEPGQDHPLDQEVGRPADQLAVLEGARLALVGVADDVLLGAGLGRGRPPISGGWGTRRRPSRGGRRPSAPRSPGPAGVPASAPPRRRRPGTGRPRSGAGRRRCRSSSPAASGRPAAGGAARLARAALIRARACEAEIPQKQASLIARAGGLSHWPRQETPLDLDLAAADLARVPGQRLLQRRGPAEVARHVAADLHVHLRPRLEPVMREEAGDLVDPVQRRLGRDRQLAKLALREPAAPMLDLAQFLDDHRWAARVTVGAGGDRGGRIRPDRT